MATVKARQRGNGTTAYYVSYRFAGSKQGTVTFDDEKSA